MIKDVQLYLNKQRVEFTSEPDILFTYQSTDYTNPTVIKNSFTKTIDLEGTQTNNRIFGSIFDLTRTQDADGVLFNPSKRVDFELYKDGEMIEAGYAKLDNVKRTGYKVTYSITLYGGLAQFFYGLTYDENGDKRTLSGLDYLGTDDPTTELNFNITKETVNNAWAALETSGSSKWSVINFAPAYNGTPDDFDADKCVINTRDINTKVRVAAKSELQTIDFPTSITDGDTEYKTTDGFISGDLNRDRNEWEMRDLRSYLQRPVFSVKALFDALANKKNNGGYELDLDSDFFTSGNPYYSKAWITLPMIEGKTMADGEEASYSWYAGSRVDDGYETTINIAAETVTPTQPSQMSLNFGLNLAYKADSDETDKWYSLPSKLYSSVYLQNYGYVFGGLAMQLVGMDSDGNAICGSDVILVTSDLSGVSMTSSDIKNYTPKFKGTNINVISGDFNKIGSPNYRFSKTLSLSVDANSATVDHYAIVFDWVDDGTHSYEDPYTPDSYIYVSTKGFLLDVSTLDFYQYINGNPYWGERDEQYSVSYHQHKFIVSDSGGGAMVNRSGTITYASDTEMRSGAKVTKSDLLGGLEGTPCDYLISYCKIFNIYMEKDLYEKKIYFRLRGNWFNNKIVDLDSVVDRSQEMTITPLVFDAKWYSMAYPEDDACEDSEAYSAKYSNEYGKQRIDTGYNFDSDETELLEDNSFNNGVTALEKSNLYNNKYDENDNLVPSAFYNWVTCTYKTDSGDELTAQIALPAGTTLEYFNTENQGYWDSMPKLQLHSSDDSPLDGEGILCFYNGLKSVGTATYYLTDDLQIMYDLNDNPCWLVTKSLTNERRTTIAIKKTALPQFSRYKLSSNSIDAAWDFGRTKELYIPNIYWGNTSPTIYENFWQSYITDLYDDDTREVEAYVYLNKVGKICSDFLKNFYFWDNSLWVCTKITDYNVTSDKAVKCTFNKVQDITNYKKGYKKNGNYFEFSRIDGSNYLSADEQDIEVRVYSSKSWTVTTTTAGVTLPSNPIKSDTTDPYVFTAHISANEGQMSRMLYLICTNSEGKSLYLKLNQYGISTNPYVKIEPDELVLYPNSGTTAVTVSSNYGWKIVESTLPNWINISVESAATGVRTTEVVLEYTEATANRTAAIEFKNDSFGVSSILQIQQNADKSVSVQRTDGGSGNIPQTGGSIQYTVKSNVPYRIKIIQGEDDSHILDKNGKTWTESPWYEATDSDIFYFVVAENIWTTTSIFEFHIYYMDGDEEVYVSPRVMPLVQDALEATVVLPSESSTISTAPSRDSDDWSATTDADWITINVSSGDGKTNIEYTSSDNTDEGTRSGTITVKYTDESGNIRTEVVKVTQEGVKGDVFEISPSAATYEAVTEGTNTVDIYAPNGYTVSKMPAWIHQVAKTDTSFGYTVDTNTGGDRTAVLYFTSGEDTLTLTITQKGVSGLSVEPSSITFDESGGTATITITCNGEWTIDIN